MSNYKEQLQQNNNELNAILETVNNLPEAGGGNTTHPYKITFIAEGVTDNFSPTYCWSEDGTNVLIITYSNTMNVHRGSWNVVYTADGSNFTYSSNINPNGIVGDYIILFNINGDLTVTYTLSSTPGDY